MEIKSNLGEWAYDVAEHKTETSSSLPSIDLYMDQVITYMDTQLHIFKTEEDKLLTSSMINNYVKNSIIPRPAGKKYSKEHLSSIMLICMLKQIFSISDISKIIEFSDIKSGNFQLYDLFCEMQDSSLKSAAQRVIDITSDDTDTTSKESLMALAISLAVESNAKRLVAQKILSTLTLGDEDNETSQKEKGKSKGKKAKEKGDSESPDPQE